MRPIMGDSKANHQPTHLFALRKLFQHTLILPKNIILTCLYPAPTPPPHSLPPLHTIVIKICITWWFSIFPAWHKLDEMIYRSATWSTDTDTRVIDQRFYRLQRESSFGRHVPTQDLKLPSLILEDLCWAQQRWKIVQCPFAWPLQQKESRCVHRQWQTHR